MKRRRFIYAAIILITFVINEHIMYGFEVREKARTYSTIQSGDFSMPLTPGEPGETLAVDADGNVVWKKIKFEEYSGSDDPEYARKNCVDCHSLDDHTRDNNETGWLSWNYFEKQYDNFTKEWVEMFSSKINMSQGALWCIDCHVNNSANVDKQGRQYRNPDGTSKYGVISDSEASVDRCNMLYNDAEGFLNYSAHKYYYFQSFIHPFLANPEECGAGTVFLPLNPYYKSGTKGYCLATADGTMEGVIKYYDDDGNLRDDGVPSHDMGFYCDYYYNANDLPAHDFLIQLHDAITAKIPEDRYWNKFTEAERDVIRQFVSVVSGKTLYINSWSFSEEDGNRTKGWNYDDGRDKQGTKGLRLTGLIVGGFRLTDDNLTDLPDDIRPIYCDSELLNTDFGVKDAKKPHYCKYFEAYGTIWDDRLPLDSMLITRISPFCEDLESCQQNGYEYPRVHVICAKEPNIVYD